MAKRMRPLPHIPASTILEAADLELGYVQRLGLWNYASDGEDRQIDYVTLSVMPEDGDEPQLSITTRLSRHPDPDIDAMEGAARLVPAARLSILTIPLDALAVLAPQYESSIQRAEQLLDALAEGSAPWSTTPAEVDGAPVSFRVLRWTSGALWVGEHQDVTVSVIAYGQSADMLRLRIADLTSVARLTRP